MTKKGRNFIVTLVAVSFLVWLGWPEARLLRVSFLNIGQGDATFIRTPEDVTILIDGGPDNTVVNELGRVMPWWKRRLDYVIVSHSDSDHYFGLLGVLEKYQVGEVWFNGFKDDSSGFRLLLQEIDRRQIPLHTVSAGRSLRWASGVELEVLWPRADFTAPDDNAASVVIRVSWGDVDYLLPADLPAAEEGDLLTAKDRLAADVLEPGHHGSKTSSSMVFLRAVSPRYCVISAGADNRYGHPHPITLERLSLVGCRILQTAVDGTITFANNSSTVWLQ